MQSQISSYLIDKYINVFVNKCYDIYILVEHSSSTSLELFSIQQNQIAKILINFYKPSTDRIALVGYNNRIHTFQILKKL